MVPLSVPYKEKDEAKALGARWDPNNRTWYIPHGLDREPFIRWLDKSESLCKRSNSHDNLSIIGDDDELGHGTALSVYLGQIAQAVARVGVPPQWVRAEISHLPSAKRGHYYLELVEHQENGNLLAKANAVIWRSRATILLEKFRIATGSDIDAGIKLLFKVSAHLEPLYGFKLTIEDVDPAYTLGDMAAKLIAIRETLKKEGLYTRNQQLKKPADFIRVAVIAPEKAAGLGDFTREATILQNHHLCTFDYHTAIFQGREAAQDIHRVVHNVLKEHATTPYDALILIRGGGAVTDLAWLNNLELARLISMVPIPVITGIGHQKDKTILDEIACQCFDTPSKVSAYLFSSICRHAQTVTEYWKYIKKTSQHRLPETQNQLDHLLISLTQSIKNDIQDSRLHYQLCMKNIEQKTLQSWHQANQLILAASPKKALYINIRSSIHMHHQQIDYLYIQLLDHSQYQINQISTNLENWIKSILGLGPRATLERGFTMVTKINGQAITTRKLAFQQSHLKIVFKDGEIITTPKQSEENP